MPYLDTDKMTEEQKKDNEELYKILSGDGKGYKWPTDFPSSEDRLKFNMGFLFFLIIVMVIVLLIFF